MGVIADWHASRADLGFEAFARRWITKGNAKNKIADKLLVGSMKKRTYADKLL